MTLAATPPSTLSWEPPGPGSWEVVADHYARPLTAAHETYLPYWSQAMTAVLSELGLPIESAEMATVNGVPYVTLRMPGKPGAKPPPPWLMGVLVRVVPALRRTESHLRRVLDERPWVAGVAGWYESDRLVAIERMTKLSAIAPDDLTDDELADHVERCHREMLDSAAQHIGLHGHDLLPPALFVVQMVDWGFSSAEAFSLLAGASPASAGTSAELGALRGAVAARCADVGALGTLDDVRALGPEVATALDTFLHVHGWRLVDGYDVDCPCLVEVPSLVLGLVLAPEPPDRAAAQEAAVETARERVPATERDEFDRLLHEARAGYGLRDDNSGILTAWSAGLLRRAMLAAGRHLSARGEMADSTLAIEAAPGALADGLRAASVLDVDALVERAQHRRNVRVSDAPRRLGPPEPPSPTGLPGALGKVMRAFEVIGVGDHASRVALEGLGIGTEPYEGSARLVTGAGAGLDTFEPGDVLVAQVTSPSYNVVLALAGALVTEEGDALSHAAIMARELGIPAVVGAAESTTRIAEGDRVLVDPVAGTVRVLPSASH